MDIVSMVGAHADGPGPWFPLVWIAVVIVFWTGVFLIARRFWWSRPIASQTCCPPRMSSSLRPPRRARRAASSARANSR